MQEEDESQAKAKAQEKEMNVTQSYCMRCKRPISEGRKGKEFKKLCKVCIKFTGKKRG